MFKKLKKIFRIIFPKNLNDLEMMHFNLKVLDLKSIIQHNNLFEIIFKNDICVKIRNTSHSDLSVFQQIFLYEEYAVVLKLLTLNKGFSQKKYIIDAGANVGYTTIYFSSIFTNSSIYAIEPSSENCKFFEENIKTLENKSTIKLYQNALTQKAGALFEIDRTFRDGKDWSIATIENENGNIQGISINEIILENQLTHISLLKIDIEGAERFIFDVKNDLSFLKITEIIAIEIHDEFKIRDSINALLIEYNFLIFESGELTIGINMNYNNA